MNLRLAKIAFLFSLMVAFVFNTNSLLCQVKPLKLEASLFLNSSPSNEFRIGPAIGIEYSLRDSSQVRIGMNLRTIDSKNFDVMIGISQFHSFTEFLRGSLGMGYGFGKKDSEFSYASIYGYGQMSLEFGKQIDEMNLLLSWRLFFHQAISINNFSLGVKIPL
jgi:hypothetical protein